MSFISCPLLFQHALFHVYSDARLNYCAHSVKPELRLFHSLPCNCININIERENGTAVAFQQDGSLPYFSLKFTLLFALGYQICGLELLIFYVFIFNENVLETGLCLCPEVKCLLNWVQLIELVPVFKNRVPVL
jgi:hypothetical protein